MSVPKVDIIFTNNFKTLLYTLLPIVVKRKYQFKEVKRRIRLGVQNSTDLKISKKYKLMTEYLPYLGMYGSHKRK